MSVSELRYLADVVTLHLDVDACVGCGSCETVCPRGVFTVEGGRARLVVRDACIECGACALNCAAGAIAVKAGVGCATAIIQGWIKRGEPTCECG